MISMLLLSGCDFVRSILGKPTSKELEQIRLEAQAAAEAAKRDSLARAEAALAQAQLELERAKQPQGRYFVMAGSFKVHDNAVKFDEFLKNKGFNTTIFNFKNGFEAVAIFGTDNVHEAYNKMEATMEEAFCPYDIWVYDSETSLHE